MLVLSRKETQRIRLGDSIVVTIVKISGDKVRVGIEAPADVLVLARRAGGPQRCGDDRPRIDGVAPAICRNCRLDEGLAALQRSA